MDNLVAVAKPGIALAQGTSQRTPEWGRARFEHLKGIIEHRLGNHDKPLSSRLKKKIEHLPKESLEALWLRMRLLDEAVFARGIMQLKREGHLVEVGCKLLEKESGGAATYSLERALFSPDKEGLEEAEKTILRVRGIRKRISEVCTIIKGTNHFRLKDGLGKLNDAAVEHDINNVMTSLNLALHLAKKGKCECLLPEN